VVSPFARQNYLDHSLSSQSSILNLIEYNWQLPAISGSADQLLAGRDSSLGLPFDLARMFDLAGMFDFSGTENPPLILDPTTG
jgi:phospholipase C